MNSKKLLQSLLLSLGVAAVITSCGKEKDSESTQPSPTQSESVKPSEEPSVKPSESESVKPSEAESVKPSESVTPSESESVKPSESESTTPSESVTPSESETPSVEPEPQQEFTSYSVDFNYNDKKTTIWTEFEIDGSIGALPIGKSGQDALLEDRRSIDSTVFGDHTYGYYTFAVDAEGYIVYATYGLGQGWGSPCDGYYHNQATKNRNDTDYFILHDEYADWPNKTSDGQSAWTLYDFVIPQGGFVITAWHDDATFVSLWKQLFGSNQTPVLTNIQNASNNAYLENTVKPRSLDKFYVKLDNDHTLKVAERTEKQLKDEDGAQEEETVAVQVTDFGEPVPTYDSLKTAIEAYAAGQAADSYTVKGVVSYIYEDKSLVISDNEGNDIVVYNSAKDLLVKDDARLYSVGDTVVVTGSLTDYKGLIEMNATAVKKVEKYGKLDEAEINTVTAETVDFISVENQSKVVKVVGAVVKSINASGSSVITLGDTDITLFKAAFPETVKVGDTIDVTAVISVFNTAQLRTSSSEDIVRYYNVTIDADGDETTDPVVKGYSKGDTVTLKAAPKDGYIFVKWVKVTADGEVDYSTDSTTTFEVGEEDVTLKAVTQFAPWNSLAPEMGNSAIITPKSTNADAGGDALAVWTNEDTVIHKDGAWKSGSLNAEWRGIIAVDAEGKIAYMVYCPANGYGGPSGNGYYAHPSYTVTLDEETNKYTTNNPAINLLEGYGAWTQEDPSASAKFEIVVPEGGFVITTHGTGEYDIIEALTGVKLTAWDNKYNAKGVIDEKVRVYYDVANNQIRTYVPSVAEGNTAVSLNVKGYKSPTGIGLFTDDERNTLDSGVEGRHTFDNDNGWRFAVAVDSTGKVVYASYGLGQGYGGPSDAYYRDSEVKSADHSDAGSILGVFKIGDNYASWAETQGDYKDRSFSDYKVLVPEGGFVLSAWNEDPNMQKIINAIFGEGTVNFAEPTSICNVEMGKANSVRVHFVEINGVPQINIENLACGEVSNIEITNVDGNLGLTWDAGAAATSYEVTITNASGEKLVDAQTTTETSFDLDDTLTGVLNITIVSKADDALDATVTISKVIDNTLVAGDTAIINNNAMVTYPAGTTIFDGTTWASGVWANYMVVDSDGKIAYLVWNVGCGYGNPAEGSFYCNEKYVTTNPCITDGKLIVPEGFTGFKFGYGDHLNQVIEALSHGTISHTKLDAAGYGDDAKNFNSKDNKFIRQTATVTVKDGYLVINCGTVAQIGTSFALTGAQEVTGTWNAITGCYEGSFHLNIWNKAIFTYTDAEGTVTTLTKDNTTLKGYIISSADADWTKNLYVVDGGWMCSIKGTDGAGTDYTFSYDPATATLTIG